MTGNSLLFVRDSEDSSEPLPSVSVPISTIEYLESHYPNRLPTAPLAEFDLGRLVGQQDIVAILRNLAGLKP